MHDALRQLLLIPEDAQWLAPSQAAFAGQLRELGLLGEALAARPQCFMIGENFLQQFSFMGCAPSLNLAPADTAAWRPDEFVYIHLHAQAATPLWFGDALLGKPACSQCGKRNAAWHRRFDEMQAAIECAHCGQTSAVCDWQWFDAGGCARQFISIVNVYPRESIPTDALLQELASLTGVPWRHFYLHAPLPGE